MDIGSMIASERASTADALDALDASDFDKPSLCGGWTVRDVVAHMTASALMTSGGFFVKLASSGFSFDKMVGKDVAALEGENDDGQLRALFRSRISTTNGPPGPKQARLGEVMIHSEDIFRSLGSGYRDHPVEHMVALADFYKGSSLIVGAKGRIAGLHLTATDTDWSTGSGPEVSGPLMGLIMAMTGRKAALADLSGEGVATLQSRK